MNRRTFIRTGTAVAFSGVAWTNGVVAESPAWPIGCFNRAWAKWTFDEALDGIAAAGYKLIGLISPQLGETFTSSTATPDYLVGLKKRIMQRELQTIVTAIQLRPTAQLSENFAELRKQIENAARLGSKFMLTFGVDRPEQYEDFYRLMSYAAAQAEKHAIQIAIKPHGGVSASSEEMLRCLEQVAQPNFKIWYDAGNIIYYTGKDPVAELGPIARHVCGFCAKDCPGPKGEVMSQFGTGKVDFKAVFAKLKSAGFNGPIMVEGVKVGTTTQETTANARANREILQTILASI